MARGVMRRKIARLEEALDCSFFTPEHAFILEMMLDSIDHLTAQIAVLDERIAVLCEPYERQVAQLDGIPGFGVTAAQDLIAEIGIDMSAFPTAGHLASWARVAPRARESGQAQGQERHRPRQPLHRRHPRRDRRQRRPHPDLPRRQAPAPVPAHAQEESPGRHHEDPARHRPRPPVRPRRPSTATSAPATTSKEPTPAARPAATSAAIERLGYKVTIEPLAPEADPETGELITRTAS